MGYWPRAQEEMSNNGTGSPKWVMLRNLTHKLVYRAGGVSELYDLDVDPTELNNVYNDETYSEFRIELEKHLMDWLIITGDVPPLRSDPRGVPKYPDPITEKTCMQLLQPDPSIVNEDEDINGNDIMNINGIPNFQT